ncbi:MAG: RNA-binding protein [Deltaproteobacteria bacterium]|nr:RNA-binding protein [Deltaproteobacteria bacterium]MBW2076991.1 RNA-binding protein [Deltaproteobacteria bacterium]MBW2310331.1 RNA-binding protein [Deltaproteobacteria bacterium]RLB31294.1 MAG: RNA-binding protein [Deltaproteobacteria bacterium]
MNIYVGNLSFEVTAEDLRQTFEAYGEVASANVIRDKYSGQSRGFGFVEMPNDDEGQPAIKNLNGKELSGRQIKVSEARPRADRGGPGRRGGGRGQSGFGGRRRY